MKQFEIRWAELPDPIGRRPVVLLTRTAAYEYLTRVVVAEVTTTIRAIPQEVALGRAEGMRQRCVANFDNVHVIPAKALRERIGTLAAKRHRDVKRALGYALDWAELKVL